MITILELQTFMLCMPNLKLFLLYDVEISLEIKEDLKFHIIF